MTVISLNAKLFICSQNISRRKKDAGVGKGGRKREGGEGKTAEEG